MSYTPFYFEQFLHDFNNLNKIGILFIRCLRNSPNKIDEPEQGFMIGRTGYHLIMKYTNHSMWGDANDEAKWMYGCQFIWNKLETVEIPFIWDICAN